MSGWLEPQHRDAIDDRRAGAASHPRELGLQLRGIEHASANPLRQPHAAVFFPLDGDVGKRGVACELETAVPEELARRARLPDPVAQDDVAIIETTDGSNKRVTEHDPAAARRRAAPETPLDDGDLSSGLGSRHRGGQPSDTGADDHDLGLLGELAPRQGAGRRPGRRAKLGARNVMNLVV